MKSKRKTRSLLIEKTLRRTGKAIPSSSCTAKQSSFDVDEDFAIARQILGLFQDIQTDGVSHRHSEGLMSSNGEQITQNLVTVFLAGVIMVMFAYVVGSNRQSLHLKHTSL